MYVSCVWGMDWIRPHNPLLPQPEFTNSWWSFQLKIHCPMKNVSLTKDCTKTRWHNLYDTILLRFFYVVFPSLLSVPLWCSLRFFSLTHWSPFSHLPEWFWYSQSLQTEDSQPLLSCCDQSHHLPNTDIWMCHRLSTSNPTCPQLSLWSTQLPNQNWWLLVFSQS